MQQDNNLISVQNLSFSYDDKHQIFDNLNLDIKEGKITTFLGANGCGKSTLFNLITKNLTPNSGSIMLKDEKVADIPLKAFAKRVATVHQKNVAPSDITVKKLVGYGRIPHKQSLLYQAGETEEDARCIDWALEVTDTKKYEDRAISELSGGQMQRVWIAMALAQNTDILFLDEPTTFLDVRYQLQVLRLVRRLNEEFGKTIIMVLHDINQALYYSDEVIALSKGKVICAGHPSQVADSSLLKDVYDVELEIVTTENGNFVLPL